MNAVEIEEAISRLAEEPFDADEFPYSFLRALGNKETTLNRLRSGATNKSDLGGVLQTNNIHIAVCPKGDVTKTLAALKASPATAQARAKFALATDGVDFEAEDLSPVLGAELSLRHSPRPMSSRSTPCVMPSNRLPPALPRYASMMPAGNPWNA